MTADERAAKQAFIDKMLDTWSSASEANKTIGIDDTWTIDKDKIIVEPNKVDEMLQMNGLDGLILSKPGEIQTFQGFGTI